MNSEETPPEPPDPSAAKKVSSRNKRRPKLYSRTLKKGARDQKMSSISSRDKDSSDNSPPTAKTTTATRSAAIRKSATARESDAARKWTLSDYKKELKRALNEISQLEEKVEEGEKQLQSSESKRARLTEAHSHSLQSSRESKRTAKAAEVAALNSAKALEDADGNWQNELQRVRKECKVSKVLFVLIMYPGISHIHSLHSFVIRRKARRIFCTYNTRMIVECSSSRIPTRNSCCLRGNSPLGQ